MAIASVCLSVNTTSTTPADQFAFPVNFIDEQLPEPSCAPTAGEHTERVLRDTLGYDDAKIAEVRAAGAIGPVD